MIQSYSSPLVKRDWKSPVAVTMVRSLKMGYVFTHEKTPINSQLNRLIQAMSKALQPGEIWSSWSHRTSEKKKTRPISSFGFHPPCSVGV